MRDYRNRYRLIVPVLAVLALFAGLLSLTSQGAAAQTLRPAPSAVSAPAPQPLDSVAARMTQQLTVIQLARAHTLHAEHLAHVSHLAHVAWLRQQARQAAAARAAARAVPAHVVTVAQPFTRAPPAPVAHVSGGRLSFSGLESLWMAAGGPAGVAWRAAEIAECESGGNQMATNKYSGAAGYWQILGQVVAGWIYDPMVNALNAVSKYVHAPGGGYNFSPWVCQ